ncbi:hypothetical protein M1466_01365 [Candidatus Dependentiae bacterium]|nr:hypothetical protein [Candidatus Dependentiae bacterium]
MKKSMKLLIITLLSIVNATVFAVVQVPALVNPIVARHEEDQQDRYITVRDVQGKQQDIRDIGALFVLRDELGDSIINRIQTLIAEAQAMITTTNAGHPVDAAKLDSLIAQLFMVQDLLDQEVTLGSAARQEPYRRFNAIMVPVLNSMSALPDAISKYNAAVAQERVSIAGSSSTAAAGALKWLLPKSKQVLRTEKSSFVAAEQPATVDTLKTLLPRFEQVNAETVNLNIPGTDEKKTIITDGRADPLFISGFFGLLRYVTTEAEGFLDEYGRFMELSLWLQAQLLDDARKNPEQACKDRGSVFGTRARFARGLVELRNKLNFVMRNVKRKVDAAEVDLEHMVQLEQYEKQLLQPMINNLQRILDATEQFAEPKK